ncbi:MAG: type II toxin-antitoxin system PemK/MazF family toxin [Chitinophagaceae bacterium]|jgi:mRNA interferase MazF|nr:type II toxin-antitoxin system PemK/MazF family toxin [Chitinophagaceae bacterium]
MKINQYEIWIADLNPRFGTETGKTRPVIIVQTDLLNKFHPSTVICPITTNVESGANVLRVHLAKGSAKLKEDCDIMIDQIRAIDNKRLIKKIGELNHEKIDIIKTNLSTVLDI